MQSEKVIVSESNTQQNAPQGDDSKPAFYMDKSDREGRAVAYILAGIAALGFAMMVGMGIFAFVM